MQWVKLTKHEDGKLEIPGTWLLPHYYDALTVLFRVENALRMFVYIVLKERYGPKWSDLEISSDEHGKTTIAALAKRRIEQSKTFGYLTYSVRSPLMHLTSGELVGLITHDSYWPVFKEYFRATRNVVTLKLQEIGTVRNALAHFRPVSANDVEVVKLNAKQMLSEVETTLIELIQCGHNVPTNTEDEWYKNLRSIGSDHVVLGYSQSEDESWIQVTMHYKSVLAGEHPGEPSYLLTCRMTTVDTPAVIDFGQELKAHLLFASESATVEIDRDLSFHVSKQINFAFSKRALSDAYATIKTGLENILTQIARETDLLREDQLARGKLVSATVVQAVRQGEGEKARWKILGRPLASPDPAGELPEYWGNLSAEVDLVSDTEDYPWMPVKVCEGGIPF